MPKILLSGCLFTILAFSWYPQVCVSECAPAVLASRKNLYIPEGDSMSLSCDVLHCKQHWTGGWGMMIQEHFTLLTPSPRVHLSNSTITDNTTRLFLNIQNLNRSDSGNYQCRITWKDHSSPSHVAQVNVTAKSFDHFKRKLYSRLLVWAAASLCFPLALVLACCFSSKHQPAPPIPPPRSRNSSTARVKPKAEVVYAALTLDHLQQPSRTQATMPTTAVVYSTLNFPTA